ncbi:unnamed protein product [Symbiodinium sp. CCMP2456]|nr:unnamed protein product [Symbiodinium sp. CCMP2456]
MTSCTELATLLRFQGLQSELWLEGWVDLSADARRRLVPDDPLGRLRSLDTDESDEYAVWLKLSGVTDLAQPSLPRTGMPDPYAAVWCELTATLQSFPEAEFTADTAVKREPAEFTVVKGEPAHQKVKQEPAPAKRAMQMQSSEVAPHKRVKQELELSAHSPPSTPRQKRRCSRDESPEEDTLAIQAGADILCQPVYSQSHWGLLVVHRDQAAHFYDGGAGMQHRICKDHAWAHLAELRELQWLSKELALVCANTGTQAEPWSCGHRAALCFDYCLEMVLRPQGQLPDHIPDRAFASNCVDLLLQLCNTALGNPATCVVPAPAPSAPANAPPADPRTPDRGRNRQPKAQSPAASDIMHTPQAGKAAPDADSWTKACKRDAQLLKAGREQLERADLDHAVFPQAAGAAPPLQDVLQDVEDVPARQVATQRAEIYMVTDGSYGSKCAYFCKACNKNVNIWSQACLARLTGQNGHERSDRHQRGLARLKGEQPGAVASAPMDAPGSDALVPSEEPAKTANLCSGIAIHEEPLAPLQASERDPLAGAKMNLQGHVILVQASDCSGHRREGAACKACFRLAMRPSFRQHIAKKAFFVDSVQCCWRLFHTEAREIHQLASQMRQADYRTEDLAGHDMEQLLAEGSEGESEKVREVCRRAECIPKWWRPKWWRSEGLQRFLDDFLLSQHLHYSTDVEAKTSGLLAMPLADSLAKGEVRQLDLQLASKIASGQLRTDGFIHALVTAFLMRCQTQASDPRYRTTSKHSDLHAVQEALATLGREEAMKGVLERFGFNLRAVDKSSLESSSFPNPYVAIRNEQEMATSVRRALAGLRLVGGRACVLLDETVWSPAYEQVGTFRSDPPGCAWIGGSWASDAANDYSYLMTSDWKASDLPRDRLAKMTLHLALKRPDHNRFVVDSLVLPRKQGCSSTEEMLQVAARFLAACASSNNQIPPVGITALMGRQTTRP